MSGESSTRYFQKTMKILERKSRERYQKLIKEEKKQKARTWPLTI